MGSLIKLNGHIVVKNSSNYDDNLDMYENVVRELKNGASIAIFPEGTRSKDGNISRFKTGAFKIAYETQADIVPIVMDAWNIVRPKDGIWFRENALFSKVLPIQRYEEYKDTDLRELGKTLRNKMALELFKIREERKKNEAKYYRKKSPFLERDEEEFSRRKDS
ncbi:MAG TPA: lysophospholipid acyltransferase family protein [Spirochaetota bacterium]|nr:lysophospholipid acyltransferase family protein [Spirochaetota bacterium]